MTLSFAPLQGYTDLPYRRLHHDLIGGVDEYYAPFLRWEHGEVRRKELRDIDPEANAGIPSVPQVISGSRDEFARLCDAVQSLGWRRIDLNLGCPFPMQVHAGRGCGLLPRSEIVEEIIDEMRRRPEVSFSVKMRLGQSYPGESMRLLPLLNEAPLVHLTLHPRLGVQQYKGVADRQAFGQFYEACRAPLLYNGDINTREQAEAVMHDFPRLKGVMIGRGLLATPWMFADAADPQSLLAQMHEQYYQYACSRYQGEAQILAHLRTFWEHPSVHLPAKSAKQIRKAKTLRDYCAALHPSR